MRRIAVLLGALVVLAVGAGLASAVIPNPDGNIYACYSNGDGTVRVQNDPTKPCSKGWTALKWTAGEAHVPVTTTYRKIAQFLVPAGEQAIGSATCDDGDVAVGGGWTALDTDVESSRPVGNPPTGWSVFFESQGGAQAGDVFVVCQHTE